MVSQEFIELYPNKIRNIKNKNKFRTHEPHTIKNKVIKQQIFEKNKKSRQNIKNFKRKNSIDRNLYM